MIRIFSALLLLVLANQSLAQCEIPWNPDVDANGVIGVPDVMDLLVIYGDSWVCPAPEESEYAYAMTYTDSLTYADCAGYCASIGGWLPSPSEAGLMIDFIPLEDFRYAGGSSGNGFSYSQYEFTFYSGKYEVADYLMFRKMYYTINSIPDSENVIYAVGDTVVAPLRMEKGSYSNFEVNAYSSYSVTSRKCVCVGLVENPAFVE